MSQTNFTPISIYYSTTASAVPTAANLVQGELAINTADGKLYYEDSSGVVQVLATKSTGSIGGSNTQVQFNNSGSLGGSSSFTWDGTTVTATKFAGALNGTVGATTASTGAFTTLTSNGATTFTAGTASTSTTTGTTVITGGLGVSGRVNAANFDGIVGANTAAAGSFTTINASTSITNAGLTSGRVTYAGASGLLTDSAALTFDGTNLSVTSPSTATTFTLADNGARLVVLKNSLGAGGAAEVGTTTNHDFYVRAGAGSAGLNSLYLQAGNVTGYSLSYAGLHAWFNGATQAMTLLTTGYVGIGTSSPDERLTINGSTNGNSRIRLYNQGTDVGTLASELGFFGSGGANNLLLYGAVKTIIGSGSDVTFTTNATTATKMTLDTSGNLGLGVTPDASDWNSSMRVFHAYQNTTNGAGVKLQSSNAKMIVSAGNALNYVGSIDSVPLLFVINSTERMRIDTSGRLLVGSTTSVVSGDEAAGFVGNSGISAKATNSSANFAGAFWNNATSGDNVFLSFITETGGTQRGTISYNRAGGLTAYNVTSDYRAKDIYGPVSNSGALIDSVPVYMGKMKDATQERPMFIAHETPSYAHTGEKDAVDKDGKPVYQQMDASALVPVMWAEIQSLRQRIATLENK